jgi:hypothetical protein
MRVRETGGRGRLGGRGDGALRDERESNPGCKGNGRDADLVCKMRRARGLYSMRPEDRNPLF